MKFAKLIRAQLRREAAEAATHQQLPAMWLQRGFVVRAQSWLGTCYGGGPLMEVMRVEYDPRLSRFDSRSVQRGYVVLHLRELYRGVEPYERTVAAHDPVELVRPAIATPVQWRMRGAGT